MSDSQRAKARSLVDADVMTLGRETQRTRKTTNPVAQANMSKYGPANPQPRLTPTSIPFKKGGAAKGKAQKAAAVAGMLSALTQGPQQPPMAAPPAAPMSAPMGAPPGMKRGGRYAKGGKVHGDEAEDKVLFKRMFKQEESKETKKMARGGRASDDEGNPMNGMRRGGRLHKAKGGGVSHVPERGEGNRKPDSGTGGNLVPRSKMARGGVCAKCGGAMSAKHMCGGGAMKRGGRTGYAMGGVGKVRKSVSTPSGKPIPQKRHKYEDALI